MQLSNLATFKTFILLQLDFYTENKLGVFILNANHWRINM